MPFGEIVSHRLERGDGATERFTVLDEAVADTAPGRRDSTGVIRVMAAFWLFSVAL